MMCVCVGYGCVCFLWVCGILAHNSCSSQVTASFSRTYLAFLPRHDYHTPSTLGLAMQNISIIPEWNWSNVPEKNNSPHQHHRHPPLTLLYPTPTPRFPPTLLSPPYTTPSSTDSCCLAVGILWYNPFSPWVSCLCLPAWLGHLAATSLQWPPARIGKEGEGWGDRWEEKQLWNSVSLHVSLPLFSLTLHAVYLWQNFIMCGRLVKFAQ